MVDVPVSKKTYEKIMCEVNEMKMKETIYIHDVYNNNELKYSFQRGAYSTCSFQELHNRIKEGHPVHWSIPVDSIPAEFLTSDTSKEFIDKIDEYVKEYSPSPEILKKKPHSAELGEAVNHPAHYGGDTVYEACKVIEAWGLGWHLGTAVKYICRAGKKDPEKEKEDLEKAIWYLQRKLQLL